jgi:hypothetical protein
MHRIAGKLSSLAVPIFKPLQPSKAMHSIPHHTQNISTSISMFYIEVRSIYKVMIVGHFTDNIFASPWLAGWMTFR